MKVGFTLHENENGKVVDVIHDYGGGKLVIYQITSELYFALQDYFAACIPLEREMHCQKTTVDPSSEEISTLRSI
ncbi:MAG: hypothetical protein WC091_05685 [Sulfuricellaceae bacterium]